LTRALTDAVAQHGIAAVFALMAVDAVLPVGGELIMVVAGAIAGGVVAASPALLGHTLAPGAETYVALAAAGTLGYLTGSLAGWAVGRRIGIDRLERHGRLLHLGPANLARAERWFGRHGAAAVFLGRLTPLVRSFISIPAGLFGEPLARYTALTLAGSAIWCFGFAALGWGLGSSYQRADHVTHVVEALMVVAAVVAVGLLVDRWRRAPRAPA
jgi:membrane protein DedA with SNARE-associated domain